MIRRATNKRLPRTRHETDFLVGCVGQLRSSRAISMPIDAAMTPNVKQAVPFFMVTNIEASLRFYVDGLGFTVTN